MTDNKDLQASKTKCDMCGTTSTIIQAGNGCHSCLTGVMQND